MLSLLVSNFTVFFWIDFLVLTSSVLIISSCTSCLIFFVIVLKLNNYRNIFEITHINVYLIKDNQFWIIQDSYIYYHIGFRSLSQDFCISNNLFRIDGFLWTYRSRFHNFSKDFINNNLFWLLWIPIFIIEYDFADFLRTLFSIIQFEFTGFIFSKSD